MNLLISAPRKCFAFPRSWAFDNGSNSTGNITNCIIFNIFCNVLFQIFIHFVIVILISKNYQVQNKPIGSLPLIKKGLIIMKLIHAEYNPMHNSININHYNSYILRIDCNQAGTGIRITPNSQWCLNDLAIGNPLFGEGVLYFYIPITNWFNHTVFLRIAVYILKYPLLFLFSPYQPKNFAKRYLYQLLRFHQQTALEHLLHLHLFCQ